MMKYHGSMLAYLLLLGGCLNLVLFEAAPAAVEPSGVRFSQSLENPPAEESALLTEQLELEPVQESPELLLEGGRTASKLVVAAHPADQFFRIYDARTLLSYDDDGDGFYHRLRVTFDADVDHGDAYVYAQLYLSYEGGPWNHYFTTDVFHILEDVSYDDYEVVTRLLEGYPTGYYDLMIELYDADWDLHVASFGPYEDGALSAIPLEDLQRDIPVTDEYAYPVSESHGGGGSLGLFTLLLLGVWRSLAAGRPAARKV